MKRRDWLAIVVGLPLLRLLPPLRASRARVSVWPCRSIAALTADIPVSDEILVDSDPSSTDWVLDYEPDDDTGIMP